MRDIVDIIGDLKYEINNTLKLQEKALMFQPSFEDNKRMKILAKPSTTEADMQTFSTVLYTVVYEETKVGKVNKATLGDFKNDTFTYFVSELRHYYDHGFAEFTSTKKVKVGDVFKKYLKKTIAPKTAEEFQAIQRGMLNDFIDFLNKINESIQSSNKFRKTNVVGIIEEDDQGNVFCKNVVLPQRFKEFIDCECKIELIRDNFKYRTKDRYPYFSLAPNIIVVSISGIIEIDNNDICHVGNIQLKERQKSNVGQNVKISVIRPLLDSDSPYGYIAIKLKLIKIKKANKQLWYEPTVKLGEKVKVGMDSDNIMFVGNIRISRKKSCKNGDFIKILKVRLNQDIPSREKYPLSAAEIEKIVDNNGIAKIYTVKVDSAGFLHADNILISEKSKCKEGDRIMILQAKENKNKRSQHAYPLFAVSVVVLNQEIPDVEEKATVIVSKFEKYIAGPLKWFGDAIIAIIKKLLGKNNLILR